MTPLSAKRIEFNARILRMVPRKTKRIIATTQRGNSRCYARTQLLHLGCIAWMSNGVAREIGQSENCVDGMNGCVNRAANEVSGGIEHSSIGLSYIMPVASAAGSYARKTERIA